MPSLPWHAIDTVLLDMDGTLLDLHYDNHFWMEHLPQRYAELHGVSRAMAEMELQPLFERNAGQLQWYCLDFWSAELKLPVRELKLETAHLIALRPDADTFLAAIKQAGKRVILITNAHRDSLSLKLERIELAPYFERLISSHDYGLAKENPQFWDALQADIGFDPTRSLFIDDTLPILRSAKAYGVNHLLAVKEPDSKKGAKDTGEFEAVDNYRDLIARYHMLVCVLLRNTQCLPWVDLVRVRQQRLVRLENLVVLVGVAIHRQGNRAQRVALFHHDKTCRRNHRAGDRNLVLHASNPSNIARCQNDFFFLFLAGHFTADRHLVTVDGGVHVRVAQPHIFNMLFQIITGVGITGCQQLDQLLASFLNKAKNAHSALSLVFEFQMPKTRPVLRIWVPGRPKT